MTVQSELLLLLRLRGAEGTQLEFSVSGGPSFGSAGQVTGWPAAQLVGRTAFGLGLWRDPEDAPPVWPGRWPPAPR